MSRIRKVTTKMKYHFHIIHSLVQTIIVEKRGSKKVVSLLFDVTTDELVLPIRALRYYRIGIESPILLEKSIVSVSYQYRNSTTRKYQ